MEYYGKKKRLYNGIPIAFVVMIFVPVFFFFLFYGVFNRFFDYPNDIKIAMAIGFSMLVGTIFDIICIACGFLTDLFASMIERMRNFKEYYGKISKESLSWYFSEFVHDGGPIMWIFLLIMIATIFASAFGFGYFLSWYRSIK